MVEFTRRWQKKLHLTGPRLALCILLAAGVIAWAITCSASDQSSEPQTQPSGVALPTSRIWLEHLAATSAFRVERLEREAENALAKAAHWRIRQALGEQRRVHRRQESAIGELLSGNQGSG